VTGQCVQRNYTGLFYYGSDGKNVSVSQGTCNHVVNLVKLWIYVDCPVADLDL